MDKRNLDDIPASMGWVEKTENNLKALAKAQCEYDQHRFNVIWAILLIQSILIIISLKK